MFARMWKTMTLAAVGGALFFAAPVQAQDPQLQDIKSRIEQLEKRNEYLQKVIESGVQPAAGVTADTKRVESIVSDYLKQAEKKKEEEAKKAADAGYRVGSDLSLRASWRDGLNLTTPGNDFRIHVGGRMHNDWVWIREPDQEIEDDLGTPLSDGVFFRRARLQADGLLYEVVEFDFDFDFSASTDIFFDDLWVGVTQLPYIGNVRAGHVKIPMSLESMTSSRYLTFLERGLFFDAFIQEYDPGIVVFNNMWNERGTWAAAFHRIDPEQDGIDFGDGEYAGTGRLTVLPVYEHDGRCLVHLGASAQHRNAEFSGDIGTDALRFRSRPEFRAAAILPRFVDTGLFEADSADLFGAEAAVVLGPLSVQAEYLHVVADDAFSPDGVPVGDADFTGYYVFVSYFLTGEHRAYDRRLGRFARVRPHEPFFLVRTGEDGCGGCCHGKGAWELAARYSWLDLSDSGIEGGILEAITLGVNWYLNPNFKVQWNYIYTHRDPAEHAGIGDINAFAMRLAFDF